MKLLMGVIACLLVAACSSTSAAAVSRSSPAPTQSVVGVPSPTVLPSAPASPTSSDLPLSPLAFGCRLPIMFDTTAGDNPGTLKGGFLTFPNATYTPDPRGEMQSTQAGLLTTTAVPVLTALANGGRPFYDASQRRWVPSDPALSSPDGASYAYVTTGASSADGATIHIVTVATGTERTLKIAIPDVGAAVGVQLDDYDGSRAYFSIEQMENYPSGVWRVDLATGQVTAISQSSNIFAVRDGSAWIGEVNPHDPNPPTVPASVHLFDSLVQVNLATGAQTTWFYRPSVAVSLLAVDASGRPIVLVNDGPDLWNPTTTETRRLDEPLSGGEDNGELVYTGGLSFSSVQPDADRIWLGSDRGIYLYTPAGGLQKVYAYSTPVQSVFPAGFCR